MQLLIAIDQTLNTLIRIDGDGWGMADETISARAFRCHLQGLISDRAYRAIDTVFFWQAAHCYQSWRGEFDRRQLPDAYKAPCPVILAP